VRLITSGLKKRAVLLALGYQLHEFDTGVARYAREAGWVLDRSLMSAGVLDSQPIRLVRGNHWDGIVAFLAQGTPVLNDLVRSGSVPVVDLANNLPELKVARVLQHNQAAGRMGGEYLLSRGFNRLLFYSTVGRPNARERFEGFARAVRGAGKECEFLVWRHDQPRASYTEAGRWLADQIAGLPLPLAVMAEDDWAALHVLEACELAGLKVPEQVSILGIDDDALVAELAQIPLSSVDTGRERIAYEAAALLDRLMDGEPPPEEPLRIRPVRIITRKSTDAYAVDEPSVAAAMTFIRDHLHEPISVDDVAEDVGAAKRTLQGLFHSHLSRSISGEITRLRLERAKTLLCESDLKISAIASRCGFGTSERMSKVFVRIEGHSPTVYRRRHSAPG
jgi:LacI family transcriptional regulator